MTDDHPLLRSTLQQYRRDIPALRKHLASVRIAQHLRRYLHAKHTIASYIATEQEVGTRYLNRLLKHKCKRLLTPVVLPQKQLGFVRYNPMPQCRNRYGIAEPRYTPQRRHPTKTIDLFITPLIGFDQQGHLIGMGGGYYDRLFAAQTHCATLGLAFYGQQVRRIKPKAWDYPLNSVVTPRRVFKRLRQK